MTPAEKVTAALAANHTEERMGPINASWQAVANRVPGWSGNVHYLFFKSVLDALPKVKSILILGVYLGRDICIMLDAAKDRPLQIVGVDKFSDTPCDDWRIDQKAQTWTEAGFGPPPDARKALDNINPQEPHQVRLIQGDSLVWLPSVEGKFDFIYLDTSHDEATVATELRGIRHLCHEHTLIAGDDYTNPGKDWWGVDKAVKEALKSHQVVFDLIWFADAGNLK